MRRPLVLLVLAAAVVTLAAPFGGRVGASVPGAVAGWSTPEVLAPPSQYAWDPQLAVSDGGALLAAWNGGPAPPPVQAGGRAPASPASGPAWAGSSVVVDSGTVSGGFGAPTVLAQHAADSNAGLDVAISGSGVRYVVWQTHAGGWMLASAPPGKGFGAPWPLPGRVERLLASPAGPVAAVWNANGRLHYARLTEAGRLGPTVNLPGRISREQPPMALNDGGAFAAVEDTAGDNVASRPPHPIVFVCDSSGRCRAPEALQLGHPPAGAEENDALALNNDGTLTVLAAFSKPPAHPAANTPWGLWASIRRPGDRWSAPQEISNGGELPLAASDGKSSAVTVYEHFWTPKLHWLGDRIETSTLRARTGRFSSPHLVRGEEAPEPAALAATMTGALLVSWVNSGGIVGGEHTRPGIYAVTGSATHPGAPQLVAGDEIAGQTPAVGIDSNSQGVILWAGPTHTGGGCGVYASFSVPR